MQPDTSSKHIRNLDILRGIAALVVVGFHLVSCYPRAFDTHFELGHLVNYNFPGHMSVLVFFILSGYVIAVNTRQLTDRQSISDYVRKRLTRIVPIYVVAILFTAIITYGLYDWQTILANLFFVSVPLDNVMIENGPLWSLNYELFYYFVFILFSYFNVNMVRTIQVLAVLIAALFAFFHNTRIHPLIISYLIGFLFWATGAMIGRIKAWQTWSISASRMIAIFILMFCLHLFNPYGPVLKVLHIPVADYSAYSGYQQSISWADLYYYPLTILLILSLTRSYSRYTVYLMWFTLISAIVRLVMIFRVYSFDFIVREHYVVPAVILLLSLVLWVMNADIGNGVKRVLRSTSSLGSISYGVYIIHLPLIYFFGNIAVSTWPLFFLKLVGFVLTLLFVSWLLEGKFQPWIKKLLRRPAKGSPASKRAL